MMTKQLPINKGLPLQPSQPAVSVTPAMQRALAKKQAITSLSLPLQPIEPSHNMSDYGFLFLGERGIGKTTLSSMFPNPLHLMFEPGGTSLRIRRVAVNSWEEALRYRDLVLSTKGYCNNVVVDTSYMSYEYCFAYKLNEFGISDPKDEGWGNAWKLIEKEFRDWYYSFLNNGIGVICIAHTEEKDIKQKVRLPNGKMSWEVVGTKLRTEIGAQATRLFKAIIDLEGYYYQDWNRNGKRFLRIKANEMIECKNRIDGHFLFTDGTVMEEIPMGISKQEAYANLCKGFNNQFTKGEFEQYTPLQIESPSSSGKLLKRLT